MEIKLISGDIAIDDRGSVSFVNDFNFKGVKRSYTVENHKVGFIRAWHGHKKEAKYVHVISGSALIAAVKVDDWNSPSKSLEVNKFTLSENKPSILFIPPGYANGFKSLTANTKIVFYSTASLDESAGDDYRFDYNFWNIWEDDYR